MLHFSVGDVKDVLRDWWQEKRADELVRKATSVEIATTLPDGSKLAIKEYARDSTEAYRIAYQTVSDARRDFVK